MDDGKVPVELRGMKDARDEAKRTIEQLFVEERQYGGGGNVSFTYTSSPKYLF